MDGRCVISEETDPAFLMAVDEILLDRTSNGISSGPILHFYRKDPSISLGYFSKVREEVDIDTCADRGIGIFRRTSGGGTIYEDPDQLIYGLILPNPAKFAVPSDRLGSFRFLNEAILAALDSLGYHSEYVPINDIHINGRKVSGCAQTRRKGTLLQHGTVIMKHDPDVMFSVLKVPAEKLERHGLIYPGQRVTSLEEQTVHREDLNRHENVPRFNEVADAIRASFSDILGIEFRMSKLTEDEREQVEKLAESRYLSDEWTYRR